MASGSWFDECGVYRFTVEEWNNILGIADEILTAKTYEKMRDMLLIERGAYDYMMWKLTSRGEEFWHDKEKYKAQLEDLRKWSKLVLCENSTMHVCGL